MIKLLLLASFFATREKPTDFPAHTKCAQAAIGAEFLARSVLSDGGNLLLRDYIAVEVGFAPVKGAKLLLSATQFTLRINGRKDVLLSQTPGMVGSSVKYNDWDAGQTMRQAERFPGDPSARGRLPNPPRAPEPEDRSGVERQPSLRPEEIVSKFALPEGETADFVRGFLYYPYRTKMAAIKHVELLYHAPGCDASLTL